jgi:uncharacterized membrane protein YjjB (DUF3815 family)
MVDLLLPCLYAFFGTMAFCFLFNIRGRKVIFAAFGGTVAWLAYLLTGYVVANDIFQYFVGTVAISLYAELFARLHKAPAIVYLVVGLIPLVPGSGIYYTMEHCITGNTAEFMAVGLHTLSIAGAIALGVLVVSSLIRLVMTAQLHYYLRKKRENA